MSTAETDAAISLRGIGKAFNRHVVLEGIDLDIGRGSCHALLGPNGSGKTTLLRIIAGLVSPDRGRVRRRAARSGIGYVAQEFCLYEELTVDENLRFQAGMRGIVTSRSIDQSLRDFNLQALADRRAAALSGGERQRLMLAAALLHSPELILLDEPTAALDAQGRQDLWTLLRLLRSRGVTIVLTTHETEDAARCTTVSTLIDGRLQ